jgi:hypothetical protein
VYYNNRAIAHQSLGRLTDAIADASSALEHDSRYVKGWTTKWCVSAGEVVVVVGGGGAPGHAMVPRLRPTAGSAVLRLNALTPACTDVLPRSHSPRSLKRSTLRRHPTATPLIPRVHSAPRGIPHNPPPPITPLASSVSAQHNASTSPLPPPQSPPSSCGFGTTRSSALVQAGRAGEAVTVARAGLEVLPDNAAIAEALRTAEAAVARAAAPPPAAAPASGGASSGSGAWRAGAPGAGGGAGGRSSGVPTRPSTGTPSTVATVVMASRVFMLACAVAYLVPLGAISFRAYTLAHVAAVVAHLAQIYDATRPLQWNGEVRGWVEGVACIVTPAGAPNSLWEGRRRSRRIPQHVCIPTPSHPIPRPRLQYAMRVFECVWTPLVFTSLVALGYHPSLLLLFAAVAVDVLAAGDVVYQWASRSAPPVAALIERGTNLALPYVLGMPAAQVASVSARDRWMRANEGALEMSAFVEILAAIAMVVELLTPARSMLSVVMMWQLLSLKFTMSR